MKNSFEAKGRLKTKDDEITINIEDSLYEKYSELLIKMNDIIKRNKLKQLKQE